MKDIEMLKSKKIFSIQSGTGEFIKTYSFRFDAEKVNLYLWAEDGSQIRVMNPGSTLYAIAAQKCFFEVMLEHSVTSNPTILILTDIRIV